MKNKEPPKKGSEKIERVGRLELMSLYALNNHVSYENQIAERILEEIITKQFGVSRYHELQKQHFQEAIKALVDYSDTNMSDKTAYESIYH